METRRNIFARDADKAVTRSFPSVPQRGLRNELCRIRGFARSAKTKARERRALQTLRDFVRESCLAKRLECPDSNRDCFPERLPIILNQRRYRTKDSCAL